MKKTLLALAIVCTFSIVSTAGEPVSETNNEIKMDLDSLKSGIEETDSLLKALEQQQQEMMKRQQDEMLEKSLEQNQRNLERFLAEQKAREKQNTKRLWIRGGLLLVAVIALIVSRVQRKKKAEE
jgi:hypothetical protein